MRLKSADGFHGLLPGGMIDGQEGGKDGAAGLDVLENENGLYYYDRMGDVIPNPELAALRAMPNVILTDHTAFLSAIEIFLHEFHYFCLVVS